MFYIRNIFYVLILSLIICVPVNVKCSSQGELVQKWAERFGQELFSLGQIMTKMSEIKSRYSFLNAQVKEKSPKKLLSEIVGRIARMMDRKMDAIKCIVQLAEEKAEEFEYFDDTKYTYYSSKFSPIEGSDLPELPESLEENVDMYLNMSLNNDTHFYNIPVNTSFSSVHVPTNIYDRHKEAAVAIQWSEALDNVFRQNYKSDPALSWQYFGSYSGIMRHYPAMKWSESEIDLFDCRVRTWYIEAATCTKDVIILIDDSGSMQGINKQIAKLTAFKILDTLSNNDYVNVLNYSSRLDYPVRCFKKMLVQATPENISTFKSAIDLLRPNDKSKLGDALIGTMELLKKYREKRQCYENSTNCNQAIMLITDEVPKNLSDIFLQYNSFQNGTSIPVRVFTYLVGPEVTKVEEISSIACNNRGYYTHVQSIEQIASSVLEYINVIARPLVLQAVEHPASWTHAYADTTYDDRNDNEINEPYRLLTSVAAPAFDRRINQNNDSLEARLLGVAGTDVPIDDIQQLTLPYKIGVNAHAFIITNNGYVLMHPGLRPVFEKTKLKINYNSVDFTEVQQLDDDSEARELGERILQLRSALVNGDEGTMYNVSLKYHYNNMRRVSREKFDFYYAPLPETPFTIALAFHNRFGYYSVQVADEIKRNRNTGIPLTSFFEGSNWRIHPKWVYCRYHYLEGHEFDTPENELLHFLSLMYNRNFTWNQQYEPTGLEGKNVVECGRKTLGDDDYYCDKDLIQMLIFDAKSTYFAFKEPWTFNNDREAELSSKYKATLRFVATMSGLTRWEYIYGEENDTNNMEFGDYHSRTIDETWYKSAVLQHQHTLNSFVYSVPFDTESGDVLVTASYAIFPKDAGNEAPASVVGFQFSHASMREMFMKITNNRQCTECLPCGEMLDCYVIDSSGYIIISSSSQEETGLFFGEVQGNILTTMLEDGIFEKVTLYDYQAFCPNTTNYLVGSTGILETPLLYMKWATRWILGKIFWLFIRTNLQQLWDPDWVIANPFDTENEDGITYDDVEIEDDDNEYEGEDDEKDFSHYFHCDEKKDLYILNQSLFIVGNGVPTNYSFYAKRIPNSNLLLVAINATHNEDRVKYTTVPEKVVYENFTHYPCQKLNLNNLPRRRLQGCFNEHPLEHKIRSCGINAAHITQLPDNPAIHLLSVSVIIMYW